MRLDVRENTRYKIPALWLAYTKQFPKPFITLFDPKGFQERFNSTNTPPLPPHEPANPIKKYTGWIVGAVVVLLLLGGGGLFITQAGASSNTTTPTANAEAVGIAQNETSMKNVGPPPSTPMQTNEPLTATLTSPKTRMQISTVVPSTHTPTPSFTVTPVPPTAATTLGNSPIAVSAMLTVNVSSPSSSTQTP